MTEPMLKCRHSGQQVPYQIHQGLAPTYVFQLGEQWDTEKRQIMKQLMADIPAAADDPNVLFDQLPIYGLSGDVRYLSSKGKPAGRRAYFYIDYVASAYWNRDRPNYVKQFGSVSRILIAHASHFAINTLGYRPGFCLHSLPTAEGWGGLRLLEHHRLG